MSKELNNKEATIAGLEACGYIEDKGRSSKFRCFDKPVPEGVPTCTYLVGKSGALRYIKPQHSAISDSVSRTDTRTHAAFRYVGRIASVCEITAEQFDDIRVAAVKGEIRITRDGRHEDAKAS